MLTQRFPFLLPLRLAQRKMLFYGAMRIDGRSYAKAIYPETLPYRVFSASNGLYNPKMSFDTTLQGNKVFNSKLAAKALDGLLIKPGETFSFWNAVRYADKYTPYKNGSVVRHGKLVVAYGGGLCQLSNLLFWVLLHSPLDIVERQTHKVKDFPTLRNTEPEGVDATITEGWIDLKMHNDTDVTYQITIAFDDASISASLYADKPLSSIYEIDGRNLTYFQVNKKTYQEISIFRRELDISTREILSENKLYKNLCRVDYELPENTTIIDRTGVVI